MDPYYWTELLSICFCLRTESQLYNYDNVVALMDGHVRAERLLDWLEDLYYNGSVVGYEKRLLQRRAAVVYAIIKEFEILL